jgi:hypothetical protein
MRFPRAVPLLLLLLTACDNSETAANRLYVQASSNASQASAERDPLRRYDLLRAADADVQAITVQYPSTPAALRIAANDNIGPYTREALRQALVDAGATPQVCARAPTRDCFLRAITASLEFLATHAADQSETGMLHVSQAVTGWPYLMMWQGIPGTVLPRPEDIKAMADTAARQATIPFLLNLYETQGVDAAVAAVGRIAQDDNARDGLVEAFRMNAANTFAERRRPTSRADLTRLAQALYGSNLPADITKTIDDRLCDISREPAFAAIIIADCPMATVTRLATTLSKVAPEHADLYYAALPAGDRFAFAKKYYADNYNRPLVRFAWLERAGLSADAKVLADLYIEGINKKQALDKSLLKLLRAAPEPASQTPLANAGVTAKNLCLIHAGGALGKQMPAILQQLRANPQLTDETSGLTYDLLVLAEATTDIDFAPIADAIIEITAKWPTDDGRTGYHKAQLANALENRDVDPLPILTRLFRPIPKLGYNALMNLKRHGHPELYNKAMSNPGTLDDPSGMAATAFHIRLRELHDAGDANAFLEALAPLTQNQRFIAIRNVFNTYPGPLPRDRVVQAVIDRYPADMLILQQNLSITQDYGLTPEEQTRIFTAHAPEVIKLIDDKNNYGWVLYGFPKLTAEERIAAIQAFAQHLPHSWIDAAGWHLLAQTP